MRAPRERSESVRGRAQRAAAAAAVRCRFGMRIPAAAPAHAQRLCLCILDLVPPAFALQQRCLYAPSCSVLLAEMRTQPPRTHTSCVPAASSACAALQSCRLLEAAALGCLRRAVHGKRGEADACCADFGARPPSRARRAPMSGHDADMVVSYALILAPPRKARAPGRAQPNKRNGASGMRRVFLARATRQRCTTRFKSLWYDVRTSLIARLWLWPSRAHPLEQLWHAGECFFLLPPARMCVERKRALTAYKHSLHNCDPGLRRGSKKQCALR